MEEILFWGIIFSYHVMQFERQRVLKSPYQSRCKASLVQTLHDAQRQRQLSIRQIQALVQSLSGIYWHLPPLTNTENRNVPVEMIGLEVLITYFVQWILKM